MQIGVQSHGDRRGGEREDHVRQPSPLWKRVLDLALILISIPLSVLVASGIALFIKFSSKGPVLFRQERIGYRGRQFVCLKFRTMRVGADHSTHRRYLHELMHTETPMTKMDVKGDPRLIPFGAALRATGLDELPQLVNILRGEMSLVGPRPCLAFEYENYTEQQRHRFDAVPGLTGLWQVSGKNRTTFNEMIRMDISYAEHKSLWLDLKIIARTIPALVSQLIEIRLANRSMVPPKVERAI